ncbi:PBECR2 nuclease fold domain-containing protein [Cellvibrio sp. PSBB023]|uniref:PBECR2 nuclease fold domain-containing protein n=1 Tax=Cellvibrio sp. PSBB023 TaxID=1945512 RepID=UPI00122E5D92|nr:PBECR2 nuclease fold domain-containing protein [Cellvibrio sp. PSBB023]
MEIKAFSLPFAEQIEFFRRKLNLPTQSWTDIYREQNDWAFVVAGANRNAIVSDFRTAIENVIAEGGTLEDFRKDFDRIVTTHGWSYNGGRNWRSRVIYETNLNSSYMAGRYQQMLAVSERRPFWRYVHSGSENPRHDHLSWNNLVLRFDNPWWQTHYPPCGWGCDCGVQALNERDMKSMGLQLGEAPPMEWETREIGKRSPNGPTTVRVPKGVDPGFEHVPGQSRLESAVPKQRTAPPLPGTSENIVPNTRARDVLPRPRPLPNINVNSTDTFLKEFGATLEQPAIFKDAGGERIVVGNEMFAAAQRVDPQQLQLLSQALKLPDEIWTFIEWHEQSKSSSVRRRYLARLMLPGNAQPVSVVVELGSDGWTAITSLTDANLAIDDLRVGVRLFARGD